MSGVTSELEAARAEEASARARLAELIAEERAARTEADRLQTRAGFPDADARVEQASSRQRARSAALVEEIDAARREVRRCEGRVAELEAEADGA